MGSGAGLVAAVLMGAMVSLVWSMAHEFGMVLTSELPEELRRIHTMTDLFFDSEGPTTRTRSPLTARHPPGARECTGRGCSCERSEMVARARSSRHAADSSWTPCAVPSYLVSGALLSSRDRTRSCPCGVSLQRGRTWPPPRAGTVLACQWRHWRDGRGGIIDQPDLSRPEIPGPPNRDPDSRFPADRETARFPIPDSRPLGNREIPPKNGKTGDPIPDSRVTSEHQLQ
jgi:hypothetical protein